MKKTTRKLCTRAAQICVVFAYTCHAHAQSSVAIYGLTDPSVTYTTNQGGSHRVQMGSGVEQGSRLGFLGTEDLGGGNKAIFRLENGFNSNDGSFGQGGRMFGRQAYLGLNNSRFGTLTAGRQYDAMVDYIQQYTTSGFSHPGDVDNTNNDVRTNNSLKYKSIDYSGLTFGGLYSFGGVAGQFATNSAWSAGATYTIKHFSASVGYYLMHNPQALQAGGNGNVNTATSTNVIFGNYLAAASSQQIWGIGSSYDLGVFRLAGNFTNTQFKNGFDGQNVRFNNYEVNGTYYPVPALALGVGLVYTDARVSASGKTPRYQQLDLSSDYSLSKRTDVYFLICYQHASSDATQAQITGLNASSSDRQTAFRLGLRHKF
jgi:predicted porin